MLIVGIDEVARGCLAGPVVSCAVILRPEIYRDWDKDNSTRPRITDSKRMTPAQRQIAKDWIVGSPDSGCPSLAWGLGQATVHEIDELNIREATFLAMNRALEVCLGMLLLKNPAHHNEPIEVCVDGNAFKPMPDIAPTANMWAGGVTYRTQVKGDLLVPSIACASILAKEFRDADLDALVASNPEELGCYGWESNRAYGTADHFQAILRNGITVWHRLSFLDKLLRPGREPIQK